MSDDRAGYNQVLKAAKNAIRRAEYWKAEHIIANVIIETLRIQNQALLEALEALEAVEWMGDFRWDQCPYCEKLKGDGHKEDCKLNNALKLVRVT